MSGGNYALDANFSAMLIGASDGPEVLRVKAGIFYAGIVAGCSCADDPTPVEPHSEYCELQFDIDKRTAETRVGVASD